MKKHKKAAALAVAAVTALGGLGNVHANTDAGRQLHDWYQSKYQQVTGELETDTITLGIEQMENLLGTLKDSLIPDKTEEQLEQTAVEVINRANAQIMVRNAEYLKQIWAKQAELLGTEASPGQVQRQFGAYVVGKKTELDEEFAGEMKSMLAEITNDLDQEVVQSASTIKAEATKAKDQLDETIKTKQSELTDRLAGEQGQAETKLKEHVEATIASQKSEISNETKIQVDGVIKAVQGQGQAIETEAKAEMSDVINNVAQ